MMRHMLLAVLSSAVFAANVYSQQNPSLHQHQSAPEQQTAGGSDSAHATSQTAEDLECGAHNGLVTTVDGAKWETVIEAGGVRLFAYDAMGKPLDLRYVRGVATLALDGVAKRYRYDLFPDVRQDESAESVSLRVDLRPMAGRHGELTFQLVGLAGAHRPTTFSTKFAGPMTEEQRVAAAIAEQKVCPVSGEPLGSMGKPVPVTVEGETIYVCCSGCEKKAKADFAAYLEKLRPSAKLTISTSTEADAESIQLQQTCPVSQEPLGSMGTPLKATGLQRDVFLCCQGCVERFESNPMAYLAKLLSLPTTTSDVVKATAADAKFVALQKSCPVMDEALDGMGGPYKTVVEGRVVFLCSPGCAKLLRADPEKYLTKLKEQGVEPPLTHEH